MQAQASACKAQRTPGCRVRPKRVLFPEYAPAHSSTPLGNSAPPHPPPCPPPPSPFCFSFCCLNWEGGSIMSGQRFFLLFLMFHFVGLLLGPPCSSLGSLSVSLFFFFGSQSLFCLSLRFWPFLPTSFPPAIPWVPGCLSFSLSCSSFLGSWHSRVSRLLGLSRVSVPVSASAPP